MRSGTVLALVLIAVAVGFLESGRYVAGAMALRELRELHVPAMHVGLVSMASSLAAFVATFVGAVLAIRRGSRWTAAAGASVAVIASLVMVAGGADAIGLAALSFGCGLVKVCPMACAVEALPREDDAQGFPRFAAMTAFAALGTGVVAATGMVGGLAGMLLERPYEYRGSYALAAAFAAVAVALTVVVMMLGRSARRIEPHAEKATPYRVPAPRPVEAPAEAPVEVSARYPVLGLVLLAVLGTFPRLAVRLSSATGKSISSRAWDSVLISGASIATAFGMFAIWFVVTTRRKPWLPIFAPAVGLGVAGVCLVPLISTDDEGFALIAGIGAAFGSAVIGAVGTAHAALAKRPRVAPLVIAGWFFCMRLPESFAMPFVLLQWQTALTVFIALLCMSGAFFLARWGRSVHALFEP